MQDSRLKVNIERSLCGVVCSKVHSPGHPSTYTHLKTPSGEPFQGLPEGFNGPFHGAAVNFARPSKESAWTKHLANYVAIFHRKEVSAVLSGDAAWLREKHSKEELQEAFYKSYPHLPQQWLDDMADFVNTNSLEDDLRVR